MYRLGQALKRGILFLLDGYKTIRGYLLLLGQCYWSRAGPSDLHCIRNLWLEGVLSKCAGGRVF